MKLANTHGLTRSLTLTLFICQCISPLWGGISLSNSTWSINENGVYEAATLSPSQNDAFDYSSIGITAGGLPTTLYAAWTEDDINDQVAWGDVSWGSTFQVTNHVATAVDGKNAFLISFDFQNLSGSAASYEVAFRWNLGADGGTQITGSSSGDNSLSTADTWLAMDDGNTVGADPATYFSWSANRLSSVSFTYDNFEFLFSDTIGDSETHSYAFIVGVEPTTTMALASAGSVLIPEPGSVVFLSGLFALGFAIYQKKRH